MKTIKFEQLSASCQRAFKTDVLGINESTVTGTENYFYENDGYIYCILPGPSDYGIFYFFDAKTEVWKKGPGTREGFSCFLLDVQGRPYMFSGDLYYEENVMDVFDLSDFVPLSAGACEGYYNRVGEEPFDAELDESGFLVTTTGKVVDFSFKVGGLIKYRVYDINGKIEQDYQCMKWKAAYHALSEVAEDVIRHADIGEENVRYLLFYVEDICCEFFDLFRKEPYAVRDYYRKGERKGYRREVRYFDTLREAEDYYKSLFVYEDVGYNPTVWKRDKHGHYVRMSGY